MKLLFVTGGDDCGCKGKGKVRITHQFEIPSLYFSGKMYEIHVTEQCPCVVAKKAMAIKPERSVDGGYDYYAIVLPKEIGAERIDIESTLETDVRLKEE